MTTTDFATLFLITPFEGSSELREMLSAVSDIPPIWGEKTNIESDMTLGFHVGRIVSRNNSVRIYLSGNAGSLNVVTSLSVFLYGSKPPILSYILIVDSQKLDTQTKEFQFRYGNKEKYADGYVYVLGAKFELAKLLEIFPDAPYIVGVINQDKDGAMPIDQIRSRLELADEVKIVTCIPVDKLSMFNLILEAVRIIEPDDIARKAMRLIKMKMQKQRSTLPDFLKRLIFGSDQ